MLLRQFAESVLHRLAEFIFPAVLLGISAITFVWQASHLESDAGSPLLLQVLEQTAPTAVTPEALAATVGALQRLPAQQSISTARSTRPHWILLSAQAPPGAHPWVIEFPSRHANELRCWELADGTLLGHATRSDTDGALSLSRGGFAIKLTSAQRSASLLCNASFRGPAKMSALRWTEESLNRAQETHDRAGAMIEAGLGVLALSMLLTAIVNRSALYLAFVSWLLLGMRMASLSAGTDFSWFGGQVPADWLIPMRQWTICMYFTLTVALFGKLFHNEIARFGSRYGLTLLHAGSLAIMTGCALLQYEQILPLVWGATVVGSGVMLTYLYCILRGSWSPVAMWYSASMVVTLISSLSEVLAASLGLRNAVDGLNSVTAAIGSALLVSAAVAEHMRLGRKEKEAAQRSLRAAYDESPIGLFTLHEGEQIINCNAAFRSMLGLSLSKDPGRLSALFDPAAQLGVEILRGMPLPAATELRTRLAVHEMSSEGERWFAINLSTQDGHIVEGSLQDISEQLRATKRLEFLVNHDPLTECLNLRGLSRQFERSPNQVHALAYFDLDRFKLINDLYGHAAGDAVLKQVCERMRSQLGADDLLARVGGDEFVIAFPTAALNAARQLCENICALISSAPFQIEAQRFALSVSAGLVATEHFGDSSLQGIVSAADTLCRMAKKRPNERLMVIETGTTFFKHHKDELELISCLECGETPQGLFLLMQPEISLTQPFDSLNFEVLVRMRKPNGEIVPAAVIIEAAEAHGKTAIIDMWVVSTAINWLEKHLDQLPQTRFVGVNLSGGSLNDESFVEALFALFEKHPSVVPLLCLEITETVALTDMHHMQRFIDRVQAIGAKVSLDDFGAGYSSFGYLKGLSVDALKLDGSMVKDAAHNPASMAILSAIGGLVRDLGMKSIGEFAENLATIKALVAAGVDYAQGYGISKPVPPERILAAKSGADFIEDREILAYVKDLQARRQGESPNFIESTDLWSPGPLH